ncbi:bifunctional diaminohydroxyphosphoribosylaminopyrimidine deaminase/5-amino-6-(5-phosphoribosylamino)uracil reductase RibD [Leeia oryzae]|uniref:bifunctional diaminohydroxyphosphoribosylaminopyrimidine deaminase/5-amino-6-(5-phosphoribosylamino)uracil reductase RibD n=1 Tax=Leeia oryzae TaxID=356662 RepID=UPI00037A57E5|nr:bifunctional diaminohydroxyphosphoribosylaminopyrimidine deaminase/5-amino-6-(5-phosphoribosylamino)uracil reductase RibD [Leeia oryzae]
MSDAANDAYWMSLALAQARLGMFITSPNPSVGCVLVKDGQLVGQGHTQPAGQAHAEVMALRDAGAAVKGATAYVTLEPCSHFGRTPPCADALINAGIARLVIAAHDPNPLVAGQGLQRIAAAGIEIKTGVLEPEALEHHKGFISRMTRHRPWLRLKIATSLDGKTALANGQSQWITGPEARRDVQALRARSCAMVTGIGTVLADNPRLNVREIEGQPWTGRQPARVILDSRLRTPINSQILDTLGVSIITLEPDTSLHQPYLDKGVEIKVAESDNGKISLQSLSDYLHHQGWNEVTVEAGAILNGSLMRSGLVDEIVLYQAPVFLGQGARDMLAGPELTSLAQAYRFDIHEQQIVGQDVRTVLRPVMKEH